MPLQIHLEYICVCAPHRPGSELQCISLQARRASFRADQSKVTARGRQQSCTAEQSIHLVRMGESVVATTLTDVHNTPSPHPQPTVAVALCTITLLPFQELHTYQHLLTYFFVSRFQNINSLRSGALPVHSPLNQKSYYTVDTPYLLSELMSSQLLLI